MKLGKRGQVEFPFKSVVDYKLGGSSGSAPGSFLAGDICMLIAHSESGTHLDRDDGGNTWDGAADLGGTAIILLLIHIICKPVSQAPYRNQILHPASKGFPCYFARYSSSLEKVAVQHGDSPLVPLATSTLFLFLLGKLG